MSDFPYDPDAERYWMSENSRVLLLEREQHLQNVMQKRPCGDGLRPSAFRLVCNWMGTLLSSLRRKKQMAAVLDRWITKRLPNAPE